MLPWESKELNTLKDMRHQLTSIWNHTELEMDDVSRFEIIAELSKASSVVSNLLGVMDKELDRLIERDAQVIKKVCSHCQSEKITICESCLDEMANDS
ncbi:MAG: hypothetical protein QF814_02105 [Candidatus Marinimicrobia bacterium]|jgi:indole-3-glycerol phosphate synthase|nr:hypothetical protein [Candidatus Neomarinimicrobiota bacterium]